MSFWALVIRALMIRLFRRCDFHVARAGDMLYGDQSSHRVSERAFKSTPRRLGSMGSVPSKICPKRGSPAASLRRPLIAVRLYAVPPAPRSKASSFGCSDETLAIKLADDFPPKAAPQ